MCSNRFSKIHRLRTDAPSSATSAPASTNFGRMRPGHRRQYLQRRSVHICRFDIFGRTMPEFVRLEPELGRTEPDFGRLESMKLVPEQVDLTPTVA